MFSLVPIEKWNHNPLSLVYPPMEMEHLLFTLFIFTAAINLGQVFFYGFKENTRPNIILGVGFTFLAFSFTGPTEWMPWACVGVPAVACFGAITGFSDSLKPNWLNYLIILSTFVLSSFSAYYFFIL